MYEGGLRIGEALSLRIKIFLHGQPDEHQAIFIMKMEVVNIKLKKERAY